ncbi:hypothetical protein HGG74_12520 [Arthrobacter sp. E918]|uniref:Asparagine synthase n=1 Tax=Arthrobacter mobilis TaxID=2724944 RepID=A0A7X6HFP6_9MICC|nr:hypothetical protein [Arthrobacter mobilis]
MSDTADATKVVAPNRVDTWETIGEKLRGSVTLYVWDRVSEELAILADPLGAGIVYYFDDGIDFAVSSDLASLVRFLESRGKKLTRSAKYSACLIVTGCGGVFPSSYDEISALDHFQYVVIDRESPKIRTYGLMERVFNNKNSYADDLLETYQEIIDNTQAAVDSSHEYKIAHLTGGFDSRVVLAGILKLRKKDDFRYFCLPSPKIDREVAEGLASAFDLTMTNYSGADWDVLPGSVDEQFLGPMVRSSGILPTAPDIGMKNAGSLILQGGYGEFYRTYYSVNMSDAVNSSPYELAARMWGGRGFPTGDNETVFTADYADAIAQRIKTLVTEGLELGVRSDAIPDYLFMRVRNRYFVGNQSREWSSIGSQFDPLYGMGGLSATYKLDFDTRRSNVFGFDLLNMLDENLIRYPYAKNAFDWKYKRLRELPDIIEFEPEPKPKFDSRRSAATGRRNGGRLATPTEEQTERANRMKIPSTRVAQLDMALPRLMPMLEEVQATVADFAQVFNIDSLMQKIGRPVENPADINLVLTMYSSCLWLTGQDRLTWP